MYPRVVISDKNKSDAERVKELLEIIDDSKYWVFNEKSIFDYVMALRSLSQYVSLIGFSSWNGDWGYVDIDETERQLGWGLDCIIEHDRYYGYRR